MRIVYFLMVVAICGICFWLGFNFTIPLQEQTPPTEPIAPVQVESDSSNLASEQPLDDASLDPEPAIYAEEIPEPEPEPVGPTPEELAAELALQRQMEDRATQELVDLTDEAGRTISAKILEVGADSLKVRRRADFYVVEIPINLLSDADQMFADFLRERGLGDSFANSPTVGN